MRISIAQQIGEIIPPFTVGITTQIFIDPGAERIVIRSPPILSRMGIDGKGLLRQGDGALLWADQNHVVSLGSPKEKIAIVAAKNICLHLSNPCSL